MKKLNLEYRNEFAKATDTFKIGKGTVMMTPPIGEDYWVFRVKLHKDQSIIGFPKFGTIGIGFAQEEDWNTNLPFQSGAESIYDHIKCNKKYKQITKAMCIEALNILVKACKYYKEHEMTEKIAGDQEQCGQYMERMYDFIKTK